MTENKQNQIETSFKLLLLPLFCTNVAKGLQDTSFIITVSSRLFLFIIFFFLFYRTFFISTCFFFLFFSRSFFITIHSVLFLSFHILSLILSTFFCLLLHNLLDEIVNFQ